MYSQHKKAKEKNDKPHVLYVSLQLQFLNF
jgi:hypothetical protein